MLPAEAPRARRASLDTSALILVVAALALLGAGCGDDDDDSGASTSHRDRDRHHPRRRRAGGAGAHESVSCEPGDGSACGDLAASDFDPIPANTPCTEIYGGPDEATVEGTVAGEPVSATLTRGNGCEIERFDRLTPLLQELFPGYEPGSSIAP